MKRHLKALNVLAKAIGWTVMSGGVLTAIVFFLAWIDKLLPDWWVGAALGSVLLFCVYMMIYDYEGLEQDE